MRYIFNAEFLIFTKNKIRTSVRIVYIWDLIVFFINILRIPRIIINTSNDFKDVYISPVSGKKRCSFVSKILKSFIYNCMQSIQSVELIRII